MRRWTPLFLVISAIASAEEPIATLKDFCDKNQSEYWAKNSESCRLVRGEYKLDQLCDGYAKGNGRLSARLQSIAIKYAELKSMDSDSAIKQLCVKQNEPDAVAVKPECAEERDGKKKISRKWWDGSSWGSTEEPFAKVKERADKGDRTAQFNLGVWYLDGEDCVVRNVKEAAPFLCRSYDAGEKMAGLQFQKIIKHPSDQKSREMVGKEYGCELTERQQVYAAETKKLEEAARVNLKKAESGDIAAMVKVGETYLSNDYGLKQDYKEAFRWFKTAADKGNPEAMGALGSLYSSGDGVGQNHEEAFKWSLKAAQKGDLDAQYFVGLCYYDGQGTEEDLTKAVQWLGKAMDRGHSEAKDKLVEMYLRGELQAVAFKSLSDRLKKIESKK
ncbi:MAG: sel1 repeat family protein [Bdellovibrionales bacterium]|nr:sel1 repeat family protein [Bdellovibrionales bacterium]